VKQGDKFPVTIAGQTVAEATVREVGDGQVTLVVPGTIVVMATSTSIAPEATVPDGAVTEPAVEHQIVGVDRVSGDVENTDGGTPEVVAPTPTAPSEPAVAVEQPVQSEPVNPTVSDAGNQDAQPTT